MQGPGPVYDLLLDFFGEKCKSAGEHNDEQAQIYIGECCMA